MQKGGKKSGMGSKQPEMPKGKVGNVKGGDKLQEKPKKKY